MVLWQYAQVCVATFPACTWWIGPSWHFVHWGIDTFSLSPWQLTHSTGFLAWITCGVSVWHFLQSTSFAVSKDAEKFASAAYAAVENATDMKTNKIIILPIFISNHQPIPVLYESCCTLYIMLSI
jgi:hypothetical protein